MIMQEFAPCLYERAVTSRRNEIKNKIKKLMIKGITHMAVKKLSWTRADGKQILWEALTSVTKDLFDKGTELQKYEEDGIDTFIENMAFIGDMGKLNIVDELSTLSAISHICRQHEREHHPALIIGAEAIILNSDIDLSATPTGRSILEYLCRANPDFFYITEQCLSEQDSEPHKVKANYYAPDESFITDCFESIPENEFCDLYDTKS